MRHLWKWFKQHMYCRCWGPEDKCVLCGGWGLSSEHSVRNLGGGILHSFSITVCSPVKRHKLEIIYKELYVQILHRKAEDCGSTDSSKAINK